jgi:transketolase
MDSKTLQLEIRLRAARIIHRAKSSHIGGVFSSADILASLFGEILAKDVSGYSDSFILSKGHCCAGVYSALNCQGYLDDEQLNTYALDGSPLMAHISHKVNHVEFSTGSLGHGLPFAVGKAILCKRMAIDRKIFCLLSDGELDEGSNWEAFMLAGHHKLDNLTAIVDYNKLQSLATTYITLDLEPLEDKLNAFNWHVIRCSGHSLAELRSAFSADSSPKPKFILCDTVKGHPISFMANKVEWHYKPPTLSQLEALNVELHSVYQ